MASIFQHKGSVWQTIFSWGMTIRSKRQSDIYSWNMKRLSSLKNVEDWCHPCLSVCQSSYLSIGIWLWWKEGWMRPLVGQAWSACCFLQVSVGISGVGGWAHSDPVWHVQWWPLTDHRCVHWMWSRRYPASQMQNSWGGLGGDLIRD